MKRFVLIALLAHTADAFACGDDGGMTLNLDTSSSSSSGDSCSDASDVVGYRQCTKFGKWSDTMRWPLIIVELGTSMQRFDTPLRDGTGSVTHENEDFTYRMVSPTSSGGDVEQATAVVANLRAGVASRIGLYTAAELEFGSLVRDPTRMEMMSTGKFGSPELEKSSAVAFGGLAVVGFQRGTKHVLLGAEVAGGFRGVSYQVHSQYLSCEDTTSIVTARGVLEARARGAVFVTPTLSVGAQVGSSLVDEGTWTAGVFLGGYTRSFAR